MGLTAAELAKSWYGYQPDLAANLVGLIIFAICFLAQVGLGIFYRQWWFFITWLIGLAFQVIGYAGRVKSHYQVSCNDCYKMQLALLTISPALIMAGVYYQLAKLVTVYGHQYSPLPPMSYSAIFIVCDIVSIVVQAIGGGTAAAATGTHNTHLNKIGSWIMVGGLAFQVLTMLIFIILYGFFLFQIYRASKAAPNGGNFAPAYAHIRQKPFFKMFPLAISVTVLFIFIRSCYRVAELSEGWSGYLMTHEVYFLVLDGLMVLISVVSLTVVYPGFAFGWRPIPVEGLHYKKVREPKGASLGSIEKRDSFETAGETPVYT